MTSIRNILFIVGIIILISIFLLGFFTIKDYKPDKINVVAKTKATESLKKDTLTFLIWNIGYAGLSHDMSFFYDGGEKVRTTKEQTETNLENIEQYLLKQEKTDFILLQEVDKASKRSYFINEFDTLKKSLKDHYSYFTLNYKVPYVPIPLSRPLGKVTGGLATLSSHKPYIVKRHQFPGNYSWPKNLFMLDRCFLASRYKLKTGKELIVINTHNSAYDDGGLKELQMNHLKEFIMDEYRKGNYLVVGGDWNQYPPKIETSPNIDENINLNKTTQIPENYLPGEWQWAYDPKVATNRSLDKPLNKNTEKAIIDFYLLSPNIDLIEVKSQDLNFQNSDHQPVYIKVQFKY